MFQEMINGSIAVLSKPSVSTFEEHEKDNLTWALIYSVIAGLINAVLAAIGSSISGTGVGMGTAISSGIFGTIIGLLISWGITFGLGRAFGGTGKFGELAWNFSLFSAPLTIVSSVLGLIPILGGIAALVLVIYNFYLSYLAIQAGMNLPSQKALYVILIEVAIFVVIVGCIAVFAGAMLALVMSGGAGQ
ncbi:YIP1 family protein [Oscillochloris sp. ZM17-4]|uniref:Yip1 family protein n=1 Tax=Oscillochloris sp. ZM17-4 TaxID=2866714 RepID=UPI001C73C70B|nr:Yip1 family protein [Oscillochloris sp. ZM17-4]MBX0326353.1 YIP1 family protein [Oscillochloris sp. ZM17-4]